MAEPRVTVLAGGVGGARLAHGFALTGTPLDVVVNVGDDTELHGLWISPDLDTVMYTLAGLNDEERGWGLRGESYATLTQLGVLGEDTWFTLGDKDLATHVARTARLRAGVPLSTVTAQLTASLGVTARLLPVTDDPVATVLDTPSGRLAFQEYFVRRHHADAVLGITYEGLEAARPAPGVLASVADADVVVIAPSNPFLSVLPVLGVAGVREAVTTTTARRVAVSPIVGGQAIKGPAAQILETLGHEVSALGVARLYTGLVDVMVVDDADAALEPAIRDLGFEVVVTDTIMGGPDGRERLARELLALAGHPQP
ncbi:LPPG domain protein containing protein [Xylanimonas cellulosilytica DSM 15894]|uniref:LPPG domain protein containing protein n=1 Tax=Xylanimonas cellulosilytica (strain DSM 15894 / JCM 12276 / CECT 5975 / KCTC 9989 / LMG 20990 / NBRC 107835 / XIL07) TaxID=446471 RepID=D1BZB8_XYLCX|nr:2-phospho-L-lactate transferase [Xylanimonas cellulosilytica]ACZ32015.1 LPPG domain protein containing protein [Xylanimonas cellulosilytica DSM 15894]